MILGKFRKTKKVIGTKFRTRAIVLDYHSLGIPNDLNLTLLNALISAAVVEAGCEEYEINGFILEKAHKMILFDNVEGGVGFVDVFSERWNSILDRAIKLCEQECCENGCVKCIGSYWRQSDLDYLRKRDLLPKLKDLRKQ